MGIKTNDKSGWIKTLPGDCDKGTDGLIKGYDKGFEEVKNFDEIGGTKV